VRDVVVDGYGLASGADNYWRGKVVALGPITIAAPTEVGANAPEPH
jgi:hypothetical protein